MDGKTINKYDIDHSLPFSRWAIERNATVKRMVIQY